ATRPWTILGRLSQAVREQNWFAVALELMIVVLGVVIGFQVTAWGQSRTDRAKEQTYLGQLVEDLRETDRRLDRADARSAPADQATATLARSFSWAEPPSRDSLLAWIAQSQLIGMANPVTGMIEALVATGDLGLIRSDSLRPEITAYLGVVRQSTEMQRHSVEAWTRDRRDAYRGVLLRDQMPFLGETPEEIATTFPDDTFPASLDPERAVFACDAEAFLSNSGTLSSIEDLALYRNQMSRARVMLRRAGESVLQLVAAELDR
ncbi:MAG: hypothetical protein AAFN13_14680, partial [Bacteroidota bacterium]